jgi:hypothetical protein
MAGPEGWMNAARDDRSGEAGGLLNLKRVSGSTSPITSTLTGFALAARPRSRKLEAVSDRMEADRL